VAEDHDPVGHGTSLYAEQLRVPLLVIPPGALATRSTVAGVVSVQAIPATIASLVGAADSPFPGDPLPLTGLAPAGRAKPIVATLNYGDRRMQSLIWDRWHYIRDLQDARGEELYDLTEDPSERVRVAASHPDLARARDQLERFFTVVSRQS
jgi:arylsulfatase A-like enzyme